MSRTDRIPVARWAGPALTMTLLALSVPAAGEERHREWLNELFLSETVYPQEGGEVQLGLGSTPESSDAGTLTSLPLAIEYGITDSWQVELEGDSLVRLAPDGAPGLRRSLAERRRSRGGGGRAGAGRPRAERGPRHVPAGRPRALHAGAHLEQPDADDFRVVGHLIYEFELLGD